MDIKQQIINEIANGDKKSFYQDCINKCCAFPVFTDSGMFRFEPKKMWIDPKQMNPYFEHGAIATDHADKAYEFTGKELKFIEITEKDEKWNKRAAELISMIPAKITGEQRLHVIDFIRMGAEKITDRQIKKMKPWPWSR